ncbi:hypothetical protein MHB73_20970 [Bacillus sp. FSL K6-6483]
MKNNKKQAIEILKMVVEALEKEGETEFKELKPRTKREIYAKATEIADFRYDGDSDDMFAVLYVQDDDEIFFVAPSGDISDFETDVNAFLVDGTIDGDFSQFYRLDKIKAYIEELSGPVQVVNLTPHDIKVFDADNNVIATYPKSGEVARVETKSVQVGTVNGIPVMSQEYGKVEGLPEKSANTVYLVSLVVRMAVSRDDLLSPDTSPNGVVRDEKGNILGTRYLVK